MQENILQANLGFFKSSESELREHTALNAPVGYLRDALHALAGLEDYDELVDEWLWVCTPSGVFVDFVSENDPGILDELAALDPEEYFRVWGRP